MCIRNSRLNLAQQHCRVDRTGDDCYTARGQHADLTVPFKDTDHSLIGS